jgi:hypothetical protein
MIGLFCGMIGLYSKNAILVTLLQSATKNIHL